MLNLSTTVKAPFFPVESATEQHTIPQTVLLHLLPGAVITLTFILLGPWMQARDLPPMWAILLPIIIVLVPMELGILYYLGYRRNGRLSLEGIVLNRERLPLKTYILIPLGLVIWFFLTFAALNNLDQALMTNLFGWLPDWFNLGHFEPARYSQSILTITFFLTLTLNGIAGPAVEELYFRGYLLPRMQALKGWAPLVNAVLFSLYHFFNPWGNVARIVALIPMTYAVHWKKNLYLSMLAHCLLNTINALATAAVFFQ